MSIWLPTTDPGDYRPETSAHTRDPDPCPPGSAPRPVGAEDGYFVIKFSRFVEAWGALGEMFVSKELSARFLDEMGPYLNQPQDRTWAIEDAEQFCGSPPPPVPTLVNLDTQAGVFEAVKSLAYRKLWLDQCQCGEALPGGLCLTAPVVAATCRNGDESFSIVVGGGDLTIGQGAPGGWFTFTDRGLYKVPILLVGNRCFGVPIGDQGIIAAVGPQSYDETSWSWTEISLVERWIEGTPETCPSCPGPPPFLPPENSPLNHPTGHRVVFGEPDIGPGGEEVPCTEIVFEWKKGEEKVEPANIPQFGWDSSGQKRWVSSQLLVPAGEGGSSEELFRRLFIEIGELKQIVGDRWFASGHEQVDFLAGGGPGEQFGYARIPLPTPIPCGVWLELAGAPDSSTREVRVFSPPQKPAGFAQGAYGWYSWAVSGEPVGERGEIWSERLRLEPPEAGRGIELVLQLKAGIGYSVSVTQLRRALLGLGG